MGRIPHFFPLGCLVTLMSCSGLLFAAESLESLIERLETAQTGREQYDVLDEIERRRGTGPFPEQLAERLIAELMSDDAYQNHHIMAALPQLAGDRGFSESSLVYLAGGLSGEVIQTSAAATAIAGALSPVHAESGLPEAAFAKLIEALDHIAMLNRSAAIEVLAATGEGDDRHAIAVAALLHALNNNEHQHTRSSAIAALDRLAGKRPLGDHVTDSLVRNAISDPYMTVRMDALEVLAARDTDTSLRETLSTSLASEIITPTDELWIRSRGLRTHQDLGDRATEVLRKLHDPPYPAHVVDAWIAQTGGQLPERSLRVLRPVYTRGELSAAQQARLVRIAETHRRPAEREMIYRLLFVRLGDEALAEMLAAFERGDDEPSRIRAGYAIEEQFRGGMVPGQIADVAAGVALSGSSDELRGIAARLLSRSGENRGLRENQLLAALANHPQDIDIHSAVIDFHGADRLDEIVRTYAADPAISVPFRIRIIRDFGQQAALESGVPKVADPGLSIETQNALKDVARHADDYYLIQAAGDALDAWRVRPPLRVALKNHENQSKALFAILIGMVIVNLTAGLNGLIHVVKFPLRSAERAKRNAIRTAMVIGWLALSAGMLVLLGAGLIGFLGHNYAPKPEDTLIWNVPAYAGTVIYVLLAWVLRRQARAVDTRSNDGSRQAFMNRR